MDREKLARIDTNVDDLAREFRQFISSEGPFVDVRERVKVLEGQTMENKVDIEKVEGNTSAVMVKVAGATAVLSLGGVLLILKILGVING